MARPKPRVILATDHAGFRLKQEIADFLLKQGYSVEDFGADTDKEPSDYPDYIIPAAEKVAASRGRSVAIIFGGNGMGEAVAANKVRGIRAVTAYDAYTVKTARIDDNANILSLGGRTAVGKPAVAKKLVRLFLTTDFPGASRHRRRLKKIADYEKR
jgi:ribose 5-phosphate isomerase B